MNGNKVSNLVWHVRPPSVLFGLFGVAQHFKRRPPSFVGVHFEFGDGLPLPRDPTHAYVALPRNIDSDTDKFEAWWNGLSASEQDDVSLVVRLLEERGTGVGVPYASQVKGSKHGRMRELRVQSHGRPIRIFYAFDPRRTAILLIGGHKLEQARFYRESVRLADTVHDDYLLTLRREGLLEPGRGG